MALPQSAAIDRALKFAAARHIGQKRKYNGADYIEHPIAVAEILVSVGIDDEAILVAALCHDVVEDTPTTIKEIEAEFGAEVAELVGWLTDVSRPSDGNRQMRKQVDLEHTAAAPAAAKTIKLADLIDNTLTIEAHDPHFWRVYRREKIRLLAVLKEGDQTLWAQAAGQVGEVANG